MPTPTTMEEQLAHISRRIDRLSASAHACAAEAKIVIERRVDELRREQASTRAAVRDAAAGIEEKLRRLDTRVVIAELSAAADVAEDRSVFLDAVEEELHSRDACLERLQVKAATTAGSEREQAEAAIRELRRRRNVLRQLLDEVRSPAEEAWREGRKRVQAARDELERTAAELEARFE